MSQNSFVVCCIIAILLFTSAILLRTTFASTDANYSTNDNDADTRHKDPAYDKMIEELRELLKEFQNEADGKVPQFMTSKSSRRRKRSSIGRPEDEGFLGFLQRFSPAENLNRLHSIMSIPELIRAQGYPSEIHKVRTQDGYILELHRIPGPRETGRIGYDGPLDTERKLHKRRANPAHFSKPVQFQTFVPYSTNRRRNHKRSYSISHNFTEIDRRKNSTKGKPSVHKPLDNFNDLNTNSTETILESLFLSVGGKSRNSLSDCNDKSSIGISLAEHTQVGDFKMRAFLNFTEPHKHVHSKRSTDDDLRDADNSEDAESVLARLNPFRSFFNFASLFVNSLTRPPTPSIRSKKEKPVSRLLKLTDPSPPKPKPALFKSQVPSPHSWSVHLNNRREDDNPFMMETFPGDSGSSGRPVVLIHHGIISSSANFVLNDPHEALAFMLADAGYDVWMANWRGNTYSRKHVVYDENHADFWNFSMDEVIMYDIPAIFNYILHKTQQKNLYFVGHSLGCVMFWASTNFYPEINNAVRAMVAMAPAGFMDNAEGLMKKMALFFKNNYQVLERFGLREILVPNSLRTTIFNSLCGPQNPFMKICYALLPLYLGEVRGSHDPYYTDVILSHFPGGFSSFRIFAQFGQFIDAGGMQMFDHGKSENIKRYHSVTPPKYSFRTVTTPVAILWGPSDTVTSPPDVYLNARSLPNVILNHRVKDRFFNHVDFLFSENAAEKVYKIILSVFSRY